MSNIFPDNLKFVICRNNTFDDYAQIPSPISVQTNDMNHFHPGTLSELKLEMLIKQRNLFQ